MRPIILGCVVCLFLAGCSFNRSDLVTGADGKPKADEMSDDGKTVGNYLRGLRPSATLKF